MIKALSGAFLLVVVSGVLWVINPFDGDDEGFVWTSEPEASVAPPTATPAPEGVVVDWESGDAARC